MTNRGVPLGGSFERVGAILCGAGVLEALRLPVRHPVGETSNIKPINERDGPLGAIPGVV